MASPSWFRLWSILSLLRNIWQLDISLSEWKPTCCTLCSRPLQQLSSPPTICLKEMPSSRDASDLERPQTKHKQKRVAINDEVSASSTPQQSGTNCHLPLAFGMKASMAAQQVWRSALCSDWCLPKAIVVFAHGSKILTADMWHKSAPGVHRWVWGGTSGGDGAGRRSPQLLQKAASPRKPHCTEKNAHTSVQNATVCTEELVPQRRHSSAAGRGKTLLGSSASGRAGGGLGLGLRMRRERCALRPCNKWQRPGVARSFCGRPAAAPVKEYSPTVAPLVWASQAVPRNAAAPALLSSCGPVSWSAWQWKSSPCNEAFAGLHLPYSMCIQLLPWCLITLGWSRLCLQSLRRKNLALGAWSASSALGSWTLAPSGVLVAGRFEERTPPW